MEKALIKESGEFTEVSESYMVKHIEVSFSIDYIDPEVMENIQSMTFTNDSVENQKEGSYYVDKNGKKYHEDDLIIGSELRDYQIKKIL